MHTIPLRVVVCCLGALVISLPAPADESARVDYERHIKPLLAEKCTSCHGAIRQEAGLRLDAGQLILAGGDDGPVVDRGSPGTSRIIARVTSADEAHRMPPTESGSPLTAIQLKNLQDWISGGALIPSEEPVPPRPDQHWAFIAPVRPVPAETENGFTGPVDQLLSRVWTEHGVQPLPTADRVTLLRRAYLGVTGLPPTISQQQEFLLDQSADAWDRLVDQLLADPAYGERWARHWMDVWRYSDWDGYKDALRGSQRHIWHWRDWIIESLNADMGYDQMIVAMLAGDETAPEDPETLRATGFLARNYHVSNRNIWLDATVEHTSRAFLALTLHCARCHDHKYDPLSQHEYYAFRAIFEPHNVRTERLPGEADLIRAGIPRVFDARPDEPTWLYIAGDEKRPDKQQPVPPAVPSIIGGTYQPTSISLPLIARIPAMQEFIQREDIQTAETALKTAREAFAKLQSATVSESANAATDNPSDATERDIAQHKVAAAEAALESLKARWAADRARFLNEANEAHRRELAMAAGRYEHEYNLRSAELAVMEKTHALSAAVAATDGSTAVREKNRQKAETELEAARKNLRELSQKQADADYSPVGTKYPASSTGRRLALAKWIVDRSNPLTARVAVNHIWLHHFGEPLVPDVADFGLRSARPEHLQTLDFLAVELMENQWSMKHVQRLIMKSAAYRMLSSGSSELTAGNERVDADNRLFWRMNPQRVEAEIIRDGVLAVAGSLDRRMGGPDIPHQKGETIPRRSLYFQHAYEKQMTMLVTFDAAGPAECYRRASSIVPQQALALSNSPLTIEQSRRLAAVISESVGSGEEHDGQFVSQAFATVLTRPESPAEYAACTDFLRQQSRMLSDPAAMQPFVSATETGVAPAADPRQRARENLIHVLFNHNDFVTVR